MVIGIDKYKDVNGIDQQQKKRIMDFLQGAVYCWCKNRKGEWFSLSDQVGGDNYYWQATPLIHLYEYYLGQDRGDDYAVKEAGRAAGRLLLATLMEDKRTFETKVKRCRQYRWTGIEDNDHSGRM
jgi:hypothetical protein